MARQESMLKYRGSLDGVRHYKIKGSTGSFAAFIPPISADRIKNGAEFARTRENMNEFGACGVITSSFRAGVAPLLSRMADNRLTSRMTGIMKRINLLDESEARGYRAILVSVKGNLLVKFPFNTSQLLREVSVAPMSFTHAATRQSAMLTVTPFDFAGVVKPSSGATHYRFVNVLSLLSDFAYDATTQRYEAVEGQLNEKSIIAYSAYQEVSVNVVEEIVVIASLQGVTIPVDAAIACIQSVGIEFLQKVGVNYVPMKGSTMMIADVF
jgi:hypothetical protein